MSGSCRFFAFYVMFVYFYVMSSNFYVMDADFYVINYAFYVIKFLWRLEIHNFKSLADSQASCYSSYSSKISSVVKNKA